MSFICSALVERRVLGSPTKKSVMAYLAVRASDDGSGIWTSKGHIADDTELSKRSVQKAIIEFEQDGLVKKVGKKPCKNGFTYEYQIIVEALELLPNTRKVTGESGAPLKEKQTGERGAPVNPVHPTGESGAPQGVNVVHPNNPRISHESSIDSEIDFDLVFDRFLEACPKLATVNKKTTRAAFQEALKTENPDTIINSMQSYSDFCDREKKTKQFIKQPHNWLRAERWTDAPDQKPAQCNLSTRERRDLDLLSENELAAYEKVIATAQRQRKLPNLRASAEATLDKYGIAYQ